MSESRKQNLLASVTREGRSIDFPTNKDGRQAYPSEIFGENVFSHKTMSRTLPKSTYASFLRQIRGRQQLDRPTADAIAHAVRVWAQDRGATHFTHWFQPQTDATAEKHDSFLTIKSTWTPQGPEITALDAFSGSELLQAEPDASSFPSGGMRSTFEARGYSVWDTTSPMFIQKGPNGTSTLYIPSVFISYNGDALDEKTVLLRSSESVSRATVALLNLLDPAPPGHPPFTAHVYTTLGTEQEFFLIDRAMYALRPDLKISGRALLGNLPPRHQQLDDHYFGKIPSRVLSAISEMELELHRLGIPLKTRHNEVAPSQFEVAPIFEEAMVAVDHNLLTMDVIHKVAHRHKLKALFHEKPFAGVNGSGKHCNWSLSTDHGENLLDPTLKPETNYRFLLTLVSVLHAVHTHGGLLRAGIASASNDHRLGANEAPPGIISVFLGAHLTEVLDAIEEGREVRSFSQPELQSIKVGGTVLDVKVSTLPGIHRDLTDRNRTSPFAFTGNKFEFRAVGSKQSPSFPMTLLNAAAAWAIREVTSALQAEASKGGREIPSDADKLTVIRRYITLTKPIRFEGDNYSDAWKAEAASRGLPNISDAPSAFQRLRVPEAIQMLTVGKHAIFTPSELDSRYHILLERYTKDILIEANTMADMVRQQIIPATYAYRRSVAEGARAVKEVGADPEPEVHALSATTPLLNSLVASVAELEKHTLEVADQLKGLDEGPHEPNSEHHLDGPRKLAVHVSQTIVPTMTSVRSYADGLERLVGDTYWPLPKYTELLFT
ncbi:MAG: glutamine synthetase type III N terminal-domain-containing protein [Piptocephalis tieghemiana]|nr:MAG: glutamine synthetase type III N terminal-domain-containing protein [Piptocephalis tieghemiana]